MIRNTMLSPAPTRLLTRTTPAENAPSTSSSSSGPSHSAKDRFIAGAGGAVVGAAVFGVPAVLGSAFGGWGMAAGMVAETATFYGLSRGMNVGRTGIALAGLAVSLAAGAAGTYLGWPGAIAVTTLGTLACGGVSAGMASLK